MKKVRTVAEMKTERMRLKLTCAALEGEIEKDIEQIKAMLEPFAIAKKGLGQVTHKPKDRDLLSASGGALAEFLMKFVVLRNAGFVKKLLISKGVSNLLSNVIHKNKDSIYAKLFHLLGKFKERESKPVNKYEQQGEKSFT